MKSLLKYSLSLLFFSAIIFAILKVQKKMNAMRVEYELTETTPLENAPPIVAFTTVALGGFRGLLADILFLRSQQMQDKEQYFELVQLASWIVKLQPRFTGATSFLAWNMAYNVSVTFSSPEDRWRWVQRGLELIRDEAIQYNPSDPTLFKELGWIYQHKMGQLMDDANRYYKTQMAFDMMRVIGTDKVNWKALANSKQQYKKVIDLLKKQKIYNSVKFDLLITKLDEAIEKGIPIHKKLISLPDPYFKKITPFLTKPNLKIIDNYIRYKKLLKVYKLDALRIYHLNLKYGDLDWRLPEAHAIYWASRGLEVAEDNKDMQCERMIFQALNNAFHGGRLIFVENVKFLQNAPNISIVDAVNESYLTAKRNHPEVSSIMGGYENFLVDAIVTLYTYGMEKKSKVYFRKLKKFFPSRNKKLPFDRFVLKELVGDITSSSYNQCIGTISGMYYQMCQLYSIGELERAEVLSNLAVKVWLAYQNSIGDTKVRRGLPPLKNIRKNIVERCLKLFPKNLASLLKNKLEESKNKNIPRKN